METLLLSYSPHLTILTESWLTDDIRDDEIVPPGYEIFRCDRASRGWGVAIIAKSGININVFSQTTEE